jgi:hypothetical protein
MSGGTQTAPTPYQPPNQAGAAAGFQSGAGQLATAGQSLYGSVAPAFSQITSNVANNPYYNQAQGGAQAAANTATGQVAPQQLGAASQLQAFSSLSNPAAVQTLYNAYDPQSALYNQQYQQQLDQTNAISSMYGTGGSPYGAGVAANASNNFNLNWQNAQLARQIAALGAYDTNLGAAGGADTAASNLGIAGLNTQATAAQLPYDLYLQQQQAQLGALGAQTQGTNASLAPTQQATADYGQYLNIGQTASQGAISAAQANNQANAQAAAGFGNLFGDVLGMFSFG